MQIALDTNIVKAIRLGDANIGSVVGPVESANTMGLVLKHADPNNARRFTLVRDKLGVGLAPHVPYVLEFAKHTAVRVLAEQPRETSPKNEAESVGLLGMDERGLFIVIDPRLGTPRRAAVVCLQEWSLDFDSDRVRYAAAFFSSWQILVVDDFGNRITVV